jgi:hypothetical protein
VLTIANISGTTVNLSAPLTYNHKAARDHTGVIEYYPHVGNLNRNVVIRSANAAGTRGHVLATERAVVDIRNAVFHDLGRTTLDPDDSTTFDNAHTVTHVGTNQVGRYALHMHHVIGPVTAPANGYQFTLIGNVIENTRKWGLAMESGGCRVWLQVFPVSTEFHAGAHAECTRPRSDG